MDAKIKRLKQEHQVSSDKNNYIPFTVCPRDQHGEGGGGTAGGAGATHAVPKMA